MFVQVLPHIGVNRNSAFAALGAAGYALGQLLILVFVAKRCSSEEMGRYALATAIAVPVTLAARLQLRYVLAADADSRLPFHVGAATRFVAITAALAVVITAGSFAESPATARTLVLVALIRAAEDAGDLFLGPAQRADEWAAIARAQCLHGLGGAGAIGFSLLETPNLIPALIASAAWQTAVTALHDWPLARRFGERLLWPGWHAVFAAVRAHAALGGAAALVSLNAYIPRYAIEGFLGLEAVGVFTALTQLALVGNLAVQAAGQAAVVPLSRALAHGLPPFLRALGGLVVLAALIGVVGFAAAAIAGPGLLSLLYRPEYAAYDLELIWLTAAAALTYLAAVLGYALIAVGEHRAQLWIFAVSTAVALVVSLAATPLWGLRGAAAALCASWLVAVMGGALALARRLPPWRREAASPKLSEWAVPESIRPGGAR